MAVAAAAPHQVRSLPLIFPDLRERPGWLGFAGLSCHGATKSQEIVAAWRITTLPSSVAG
jgi:hypothetical protein